MSAESNPSGFISAQMHKTKTEPFLQPISVSNDDENRLTSFVNQFDMSADLNTKGLMKDLNTGKGLMKSADPEIGRDQPLSDRFRREQRILFDDQMKFLDIRQPLAPEPLEKREEFTKERPSKSVPTTRVASAENSSSTSPIPPEEVAPRRKADLAQYNSTLYLHQLPSRSDEQNNSFGQSSKLNPFFFEDKEVDAFSNAFNYLQLNSDNDRFPSLLSSTSAALDLSGQQGRQSSTMDQSRMSSDWPSSSGTNGLLQGSGLHPSHAFQGHGQLKKSASFNNVIPSAMERRKHDSMSEHTPSLLPKYSGNFYGQNDLLNQNPNLSSHPSTREPTRHESPFSDSDAGQGQQTPGGICRFFQAGHCSRGDRCSYSHVGPTSSGRGFLTPLQMAYPAAMASFAPAFYGQYGFGGMMAGAPFPFGHPYAGFAPGMHQNNFMRMHSGFGMGKFNNKRYDHEANRFAGVAIEDLTGQIYSLCKDQHGCRYLQKKLEEQNENHIALIFNEVFSHFAELMTDPFGNYLCQKLLEHCNDEQRTAIVENVAPELVNISLNMHGTRAVQKMVEFLSTPQQIRIVVVALNPNVVTLIKDLNGNHVIQKCLNRLQAEDNQFVYNAVTQHCVEVATHRHGCCVLQRCIDHASEKQKVQLVTEITFHALTLVQDPFGNYVVQYVLDLGDRRFSDGIIRRFIGNVCLLSVQKFSSNVMEKCIRVAEPETRKLLIEELLNKDRLDKLLRDSYANYVVQTGLDYADPVQRAKLIDCIRPLLPAIRNTPYGKRLQGKLHRDQISSNLNVRMDQLNMLGVGYPFGVNGFGNMNMNLNFPSGGLVGLNEFNYPHPSYM